MLVVIYAYFLPPLVSEGGIQVLMDLNFDHTLVFIVLFETKTGGRYILLYFFIIRQFFTSKIKK